MSEYGFDDNERCQDCGGSDGQHFSGCDYDGTNGGRSYSGRGISSIGLSVAAVGGLFLALIILAKVGGEAPVGLIIISWFVCVVGLSVWFEKIGF